MMLELIEIRCPFKQTAKYNGQLYPCNSLCVRVYPGSSGEAWCKFHKLTFEFEVDNQNVASSRVRAQAIPNAKREKVIIK